MQKNLRALLCLLLSLTLLAGLCACGESEEEPFTNPTFNPEEYDPTQSYHINKNSDNSFDYTVLDYAGNAFLVRTKEPRKPEFIKLNDTVLQITAPMHTAPRHRWALFCDVRTQKVSPTYHNFLAAKGNNVAYLEQRTGQFCVILQDVFDESVYLEVTPLEGLEINRDGYLYDSAVMNKDGNLEITYLTKDGNKTTTIKLP